MMHLYFYFLLNYILFQIQYFTISISIIIFVLLYLITIKYKTTKINLLIGKIVILHLFAVFRCQPQYVIIFNGKNIRYKLYIRLHHINHFIWFTSGSITLLNIFLYWWWVNYPIIILMKYLFSYNVLDNVEYKCLTFIHVLYFFYYFN